MQKKTKKLVRKAFTGKANLIRQTKSDGQEEGIIEAYVSVFNVVDSYGDVIERGAFIESLERKLPKGVWMHNWDQPIAKTLEAKEDAHGLFIRGQFNLDTQRGREAFSDLKFGTTDEFSIGFYIEDGDLDDEAGVFRIKKVRLVEWSPVLAGANPDTELISVKSAEGDEEDTEEEEESEEETTEEEEVTETPVVEPEAPAEEVAEEETVPPAPEEVPPGEEKTLKEGKVLSEKNRELIGDVINGLSNIQSAIKEAVDPLQKLLDASSDTKGVKVESTTAESKTLLRVRQAVKQIDKASEFVLRITK